MNSGQPRETLWQTTQAIDRIDERRLAIARDGIHIQLDLLYCWSTGAIQVLVICVKRHCMPHKIDGVRLKTKLLVDLCHGVALRIHTLERCRLCLIPVWNELEEILAAVLLQEN